MGNFFITSSGTGTGKTYLTCGLCRCAISKGIKISAIKPVITGFSGNPEDENDTNLILKSQELEISNETLDSISPWRYELEDSPHIAAKQEINIQEVVDFCISQAPKDINLIEGVGGIMAPINYKHTFLDIIKLYKNSETIIVFGTYLGAISHALTAIEICKMNNINIRCIIFNQQEEDTHYKDKNSLLKVFENFYEGPIFFMKFGKEIENHNVFEDIINLLHSK